MPVRFALSADLVEGGAIFSAVIKFAGMARFPAVAALVLASRIGTG